MTPLIQVDKLCKYFRTFQRREGVWGSIKDLFHREYQTIKAVDQISFSIQAGERVGYIGANGAGKSTTIKMLTGILTPTSGTATVGGLSPSRDREQYVRGIGVVFGQRTQLWWDLAVVESFRLLAKIYGVSPAEYTARLKRFDEVLGIGELLHTPVRKLSLGQKMRCELAAALLHSPRLLFLDEPTIGLDVVAKNAIREFLLSINREHGVTLLLTTHDLRDIEELCERVIIIHRGRLLFDGPLDELHARLGGRVRLHFTLTHSADAATLQALNLPAVTWTDVRPGVVGAEFSRAEISRVDVIKAALGAASVDDVAMEEVGIEEIVHDIFQTGDGQAGGAGETTHAPA